MLSRRSFAKFCGLSTIPLLSGFQPQVEKKSQPTTKSVVFDSNLLMPDVASVFTKTEYLEFPLDFIGDNGKGDSVRLIPYMIQETIEYDSKYAGRTDVLNKIYETLAIKVKNHIEADMISLLFYAASENNYIKSWEYSKKLFFPPKKLIVSPETLDSGFNRHNNTELICSHLLGKDQPLQDVLTELYKLPVNSNIVLSLNLRKTDRIILSELPTLPAKMGFNTTFEFSSKTCKVTEIQNRKEGKELVSIAYFCAMGVLDHRYIHLINIET